MNVTAYDYFLKITKPEEAAKIEKLKLPQDIIFKTKFWKNLELSKNRFPNLRKISIKGLGFDLFNLKYFKNTQIESFNFRNTVINKLEYIEPLLGENKRVMIGEDTALMAVKRAKDKKDYNFLTLAIQTGSFGRKHIDKLAKELLALAVSKGHLESMQQWAVSVILPANTPKIIQEAISIIRHPPVEVITSEEGMLCVYADILANPVYKRIYESTLMKDDRMKIPMSSECLEKMTDFELKKRLAPDIHLDTLVELAHFAEMYFWEDLKEAISKYAPSFPKSENPIDDLIYVLKFLIPGIPDFMKLAILSKVKIEGIYVYKEGWRIKYRPELAEVIQNLPSILNIHLKIDLNNLDLETLQIYAPYHDVNCLELINSGDNLVNSLISIFSDEDQCLPEKIRPLASLFPSCLEVNVSQLDYSDCKEDLDSVLASFNNAIIQY